MTSAPHNTILTINGGSSSIRFALFRTGSPPVRLLRGMVERIGLEDTRLTVHEENGTREVHSLPVGGYAEAADAVCDRLEQHGDLGTIAGIGHRVVYGMGYTRHTLITQELVDELRRVRIDQDHLPLEITLIDELRRRFPDLPHVACFDTAFHHTMPRTATLLPLPRRFHAAGVRKYGYHGLSYSFVIEELARVAGRETAEGKVILAHLGNGASLAAVTAGRSVDTTMSFTPTSGLPMGTRSGDLDPSLAAWIQREEGMTPEQFDAMVRRESGLLGISEISSDMRDLLASEESDPRAAEAIGLFCYHVRRGIGAFAAVLGGLDTLVFTGGIGENSPEVRARVCEGLGFLGIDLHDASNRSNHPLISTEAGRTAVYVIPTDEEQMIARSVIEVIDTASA